jgi:ADP-ribosylglycohydrolase
MIGAIIGDIVGSRFEFNNHCSKDFKLFTRECRFTDDTVMTLAIAEALMKTESDLGPMAEESMRRLGRKHPRRGYGTTFMLWLQAKDPFPYYSYGNGAAMRVSPVAWAAHSLQEAVEWSRYVTDVTHDHPEGFKGAEAVTVAIWMARHNYSRGEIGDWIDQHYYHMDFTIDEIRPTYQFDETCLGTVPQAIEAFIESSSFEDAIRTAVSVGGDSDTLAAITGSIAEAYYGVPRSIKDKALSYLTPDLLAIYDAWTAFNRP